MKSKKIYFFIATVVVVLSMLNITAYANNTKITYKNLVGDNRYHTSILVSKESYPKGAKNVILVNGTSNIDGMVATTLAKKLSAPILLTTKDKLRSDTKNEIERLKPNKVYLIGGTSVISDSIPKELKKLNILPERLYGNNKYITATAVAKKVSKFSEVIICNSKDEGKNASAIAAVAARNGIPILYNDSKTSINTTTYNFIKQNVKKIKTIYVVGNGISKEQQNWFNKYKIKIVKIKGDTPQDINLNMLNIFKMKYTSLVLVNNTIDAIPVNCLAARKNALLLFTGNNLTEAQKKLLKNNAISTIYYTGGGKIKGAVKEAASIIKNGYTNGSKLILDKSKVVFYVPHQDDESLYYSQTILKAIKEKGPENVYVVMITDGSASVTQKLPQIKTDLAKTKLTFSQARDNEYIAATKILFGIDNKNINTAKSQKILKENILFNEDLNIKRLKDGKVCAADVKATMKFFENKFKGDVTHITYTFKYDYHKDHLALGTALNELYYDLSLSEESFNSVYFLIRANLEQTTSNNNKYFIIQKENVKVPRNIKMFKLQEMNYEDRIINAINMYKVKNLNARNKNERRIGIGDISVKNEMKNVVLNVNNKTLSTMIHMPY